VPPPYDPSDQSGIVIFGGTTSSSFNGQYFNDVYVLNAQDGTTDGRAWTLLSLNNPNYAPTPRCLSAVAVDQDTRIMYMFGGFNGVEWFSGMGLFFRSSN